MEQEREQKLRSITGTEIPAASQVATFDFRKPGQTSGSQMRAIYVLKQKFLDRVVSSLSAYLRSSVSGHFLAVDHISYGEFLKTLPAPNCVIAIGIQPPEDIAVLELGHSLLYPIIEILLGGTGKTGVTANREITEIEQSVLDGLFRVIVQALADTWKDVVPATLTLASVGQEARLLHASHEPVVALSFEIKLENCSGRMNLAIPTEVLTMPGEEDAARLTLRKAEAGEDEQRRMLERLDDAQLTMDVQLEGTFIRVRELLELKQGDVLSFDVSAHQPLGGFVNGNRKYEGQIVSTGKKKAFRIE